MNIENNIDQKSKNNAISAYLMILISGIFLLNKNNKYLNNSFVRSHTKVAFLIHIGFLINFIIFSHYDFLKNLSILGYSINYIITSSIFILLFTILLFGIYKASQSKSFKIGDFLSIGNRKKIIDINGDKKLDEKDKLTLILAHIPLIGYIVSGKYYKNKILKNIVSFNLLVSFSISIIYILGYYNLSLFLLIPYIIFTVYSSMNIITNNTIIGLNIEFISMPENKINNLKALFKYIKNYFSKNNFIVFLEIKEKERKKREKEETENKILLERLDSIKIPKMLIYIPILNIITLFFKNKKEKFHIINGLIITLIFIITLILNYFYIIDSKINLLLLFPIFFGVGYIESRPAYKMPFIFDIFEILNNFKKLFIKTNNKVKEIKSEIHEENIKVGENKKTRS